MESQRDFLLRLGLLHSSDTTKVEAAKAEYRKQYKREKNKEYQKSRMYVRIMLLPKEKQKLSVAAKNHGKKLAVFVKEVVLAHLEKVYVLPDETDLRNLLISHRRIGNNVNQIARNTNESRKTRYMDVVRLQNQLFALEKETERYLRKPMTLENLVNEIGKKPELLLRTKKLLAKKGFL